MDTRNLARWVFWLALAIVIATAWMSRYTIAPNVRGASSRLDRWTGEVTLCYPNCKPAIDLPAVWAWLMPARPPSDLVTFSVDEAYGKPHPNPFDQFDPPAPNPFAQFDAPPQKEPNPYARFGPPPQK